MKPSRNIKHNSVQKIGLRANKDLGQHFLVDENVLAQIVQVADLKETDSVVEIGPGQGVLTERLLQACQKVLAFELDERLIMELKIHFYRELSEGLLELIEGDFLREATRCLNRFAEGGYKVVANIPYQITTPLLRLLLEGGKVEVGSVEDGSVEGDQVENGKVEGGHVGGSKGRCPRPSEMVLLIQDEVALRLCAKERTGERSYLSVLCQYYSEMEYIMKVSPKAFKPAPKVNSAVIRIKLLPSEKRAFSGASEQEFLAFVKRYFIEPRKQLKNVMAGILGVESQTLEDRFKELGFSDNIRAQELSINDWIRLYDRTRNC